MSDQPRDDNGQFTADTSDLYGQQALEAENGYTPMVVANPVKDASDDFSVGEKEALDIYSGVIGEEEPILEIEYKDVADGSKRDANEVVSLEQAAHDLAAWREAQEDSRAASISKEFADTVDAFRGENAAPEADKLATDKPDAASTAAEPPAKVDGLDDEVAAALQKPQIRQAIEQEFSKATEVQKQFSDGLERANSFARAAFIENFPELAGLPIEHLQPALAILQQQNPQRFQAAMATLNRVGQIEQARLQNQQRENYLAEQNFKSFGAAEDAKVIAQTGKTQEQLHEIGRRVAGHLEKLGIDRQTLAREWSTNPMLRSAEGQKVLMRLDELETKYAAIVNAKTAAASKPLPPVQRPGTSQPRSRNAEGIEALEAQLAATSGEKQIRAAAALTAARRAARGN